jgi:hypothetical protein
MNTLARVMFELRFIRPGTVHEFSPTVFNRTNLEAYTVSVAEYEGCRGYGIAIGFGESLRVAEADTLGEVVYVIMECLDERRYSTDEFGRLCPN